MAAAEACVNGRPNDVADSPSLRQLPSVLYSRKLVEAQRGGSNATLSECSANLEALCEAANCFLYSVFIWFLIS
jgi:hypothetical protein